MKTGREREGGYAWICARTAIGTKGIGLIPKDAMTTCYAKMLLKVVSKS